MMENFSASLIEDVRHERSLTVLLSLSDEGILKQSGSTDREVFSKKSCIGKTT